MNTIKYNILKDVESLSSLSTSLKISIMLAFGLGYYRFTLFVLSYFIFKALLRNAQAKLFLQILYVPLIVLSVYFDYRYGLLWSVFRWEKIYHPILLFVILDYTTTKYVNTIAEYLSGGRVFSYCKLCKYENIKLTKVCKNCGYENAGRTESEDDSYNVQIKDVSCLTNYALLSHKLNKQEIYNLSLENNEKLCVCLKVNFINAIYIDNVKKLCTYVVITNRNLIFLNMMMAHRGWRFREKVSLNSIEDVCAATKKIGLTDRKIVKVTTNKNKYEFFLWLIDRSEEEHNKYANILRNIMVKAAF